MYMYMCMCVCVYIYIYVYTYIYIYSERERERERDRRDAWPGSLPSQVVKGVAYEGHQFEASWALGLSLKTIAK